MKTVVLFFLNNQLYMLTVTVRRKGLAFFFLAKDWKRGNFGNLLAAFRKVENRQK